MSIEQPNFQVRLLVNWNKTPVSFLLEFFVARLVHRICYVEILIVVLLPLIGLSSLQSELKLTSQRTCFNCWGPELIIFEVFFASRDIGISSFCNRIEKRPFYFILVQTYETEVYSTFAQTSKIWSFNFLGREGGKLIPKSSFSCLVLLQSNEIHRIWVLCQYMWDYILYLNQTFVILCKGM